MSVLDRSALVDSPLADLHAIASELSLDGFRRLRRAELIDAILDKQGGGAPAAPEATPDASSEDTVEAPVETTTDAPVETTTDAPVETTTDAPVEATADAPAESAPDADTTASDDSDSDSDGDESGSGSRRRRGRRGGRGRGAAREEETESTSVETTDEEGDVQDTPKPRRSRSRSAGPKASEDGAETSESAADKPARGRRGRGRQTEDEPAEAVESPRGEEEVVEGVVELLPGGSGFVRVAGSDPSDNDVYISSAQVKRCELVSGDKISGPKRAPRRSERFASLIRVETINGRPASELADSVRFDDLPAALPAERIKVGSEDPTLKAIEWLTPFGRGSRVTITGAARAGKTEALRRLATALAGQDGITLSVALAGVRPEEISEWPTDPAGDGVPAPTAAVSFATSEEVQSGAIEPVVDQARRLAARGEHAVVLIDTLDGLSPLAARKVMASARNIVDGGSVTIIATATSPVGGETTVIALDVGLTSIGRFPALDLVVSGTLRPELLVGDAGAEAIARTRAEVSEDDED